MRLDDQRVRGLTLHLERLTRDCRRIFDADLDPDRVRHLLRHTLADTAGSVLVRVTVFDPDLELGRPGADAEPQLLVTTRLAATAPLPPLRLQSAPHCRELPEVKHVGLFGALRWRRVAQRNGFDDALFTDAGAAISEAATSNIGFVDGERIVWPEADCLAGVTMRLINKARQADATTTPVTISDLAGVDAVFATNAVVGVRSVSAVDGIQWSDEHPVLDILRRQYAGIRPELL
jgi:branched-subunit amino acid aminotransferase/4-amino-4-deoxychorismate lyase